MWLGICSFLSIFVFLFDCLFYCLNMGIVGTSNCNSLLLRQYLFSCPESVTVGVGEDDGTKADLTTEGATVANVQAPERVRFSRSCGCNIRRYVFRSDCRGAIMYGADLGQLDKQELDVGDRM